LSFIIKHSKREDQEIIQNLYNKIFEPPNISNNKKNKDIRKLGLEGKEREEGEVILLSIILKNSSSIAESNFLTFIVEKVLIWSENGYDEYFLHLI